jgi:hypothetical protein
MEKKKLPNTIDGNVNRYCYYGKQDGSFPKELNRIIL